MHKLFEKEADTYSFVYKRYLLGYFKHIDFFNQFLQSLFNFLL